MNMNVSGRFAPKIALFGTGFVGRMTAKLVHEKGWNIVAAYNRAGPKIGQDIGLFSGLEQDLGVRIQDYETADYSALDADIVLIAGPDYLNDAFPIYEKFLKAGVNVLSFGSHAYRPDLFYPEIAARIDELARENNVTFTGSGLWDSTRIWAGLVAAGPALSLDSIEYLTDTEALRQGTHWAPLLGMEMTPEEYKEKVGYEAGRLNHVLQIPCLILLKHFGYDVETVKMFQEPMYFDEPVYSEYLEREVPAGRCIGTSIVTDVTTKQGVTAHSRFNYRLFKQGEQEHGTWKINGYPGMEVRVVRHDSGVAQASSLINRVPDVIAAAPGIVTIMEMGPERPSVFL